MDKKEDWNLELSEYIKQGEPNRVEKTKTWETAIGLQEVDGLKPSKYLIKTAKEHIEGNIDIKEVKTRIDEYYEVQGSRKNFEKDRHTLRNCKNNEDQLKLVNNKDKLFLKK